MRALIKPHAGPTDLELVDVGDIELRPDEVRIELIYAGICHTDLAMLAGDFDASAVGYRPHYPLIMGHEGVGRIVELGSDVVGLSVGERVISGCNVTCRRCRMCVAGRSMLCEKRWVVGLDRDGTFRERYVLPSLIVRGVPDIVSDRLAALAEPFAVAAHAVDQAALTVGDRIAVVGPGTVGLLTVGALAGRAVSVFGTAGDASQLKLATTLGADAAHVLDAADSGFDGLFDVVIETAGHVAAVEAALRLVAPGGRLICVGLPKDAAAIRTADLAFTERRIIGSRSYDLSTWNGLGERLAAAPALEQLVSHTLPLTDYEQAIALLTSRQATKVLLQA